MIKFFRHIRKSLLSENKLNKYLIYAIGEIVLVVIGILIALQINNWNEERIEKIALNGLLQNISNGVQSDIRNLNLLVSARRNMGEKTYKIFKNFIPKDINNISLEDVSFVNSTFGDINNMVFFRYNFNAFESLNNSNYFGKLQNTDLASLLSASYTNAEKIKEAEETHNEVIEKYNQEWFTRFRDNEKDLEIFLRPYDLMDNFSSYESKFLEILRDVNTTNILGRATYEPFMINQYEEQILMANTIIDMVKNSETSFDEKTKLDFSGILYSFADADLISILINGKVPTGFDVKMTASDIWKDSVSNEDDCLVFIYPENTYEWASPYFEIAALGGRVNEMDFSGYTKLVIEMKGDIGGETFEITMKDKNDPPDGSESRVKIELTNDWKTYTIETSQFKNADMKTIMVPLAIVFQGKVGKTIKIRTIQFKKD